MSYAAVCECILKDGLDAVLTDDRVPVARAVLGVEAHVERQIIDCQYYMKKGIKDNQKIQPNSVGFFLRFLFKFLCLFNRIIDELIDEVLRQDEDTESDKDRGNSRDSRMIWEEELISKCPDATPEQDDGRSDTESLESTLPEVGASRMFSEDMEIHIQYWLQ